MRWLLPAIHTRHLPFESTLEHTKKADFPWTRLFLPYHRPCMSMEAVARLRPTAPPPQDCSTWLCCSSRLLLPPLIPLGSQLISLGCIPSHHLRLDLSPILSQPPVFFLHSTCSEFVFKLPGFFDKYLSSLFPVSWGRGRLFCWPLCLTAWCQV